MNQKEINKECVTCNKTKCPKDCFNKHVGSIFALQKLLDEISVKGYIVNGNPEIIESVKEQ